MPDKLSKANRIISAIEEDIESVKGVSLSIVCEGDPDSLVPVLMIESRNNIDQCMKDIAQKYSLKFKKSLKTMIIVETEDKELA